MKIRYESVNEIYLSYVNKHLGLFDGPKLCHLGLFDGPNCTTQIMTFRII